MTSAIRSRIRSTDENPSSGCLNGNSRGSRAGGGAGVGGVSGNAAVGSLSETQARASASSGAERFPAVGYRIAVERSLDDTE